MALRTTILAPGEYFHIYNRGNSKQKIFLDDKDRQRFVKLLYLANSTVQFFSFRDDIVKKGIEAWDFERSQTLVSIGAWVLMPNHFHIYLTSPDPGSGLGQQEEKDSSCHSNIALFMNKLTGSYAKYFNEKYKRTGSLFEGRFKATHIKTDAQAKYLFSYTHLNPLKLIDSNWQENCNKDNKRILQYLSSYEWSSYKDYTGFTRQEKEILQKEDFPDYFSKINDFDSEIFYWINYKETIKTIALTRGQG